MAAPTLVRLAAALAYAPHGTAGIIVKLHSSVLLEKMSSRAKMTGPQRATVTVAVASANPVLLESTVK